MGTSGGLRLTTTSLPRATPNYHYCASDASETEDGWVMFRMHSVSKLIEGWKLTDCGEKKGVPDESDSVAF